MACCALVESSHRRISRRRWSGHQCPRKECQHQILCHRHLVHNPYIATGEVTTLEHELGDDTVELGANVTLALLLGLAELQEILRSPGDNVVEKFEVNAAGLF
jgi:hypothetical protein